MPAPFVSVLIDTYNHERFIEAALESVFAQDFPSGDREILVVDDGSTDRTPEILQKFESQIRVLRKTNGGQASAFNHGIPECRGEIIAFLDGDDLWAPDKLRALSEVMDANPKIGMMGHSFDIIQTDQPSKTVAVPQDIRINLGDPHNATLFRLHRPYFGTSRLALRAAVARKCLPVPEPLVFEADEYLFTVAAALSGGIISPKVLTHYRIHGQNLFLAAGGSLDGVRRKQRVLEALAENLRHVLPQLGVPPDSVHIVLEMVEAEEAQLRLSLDGGSSWEVFRTETALYRMQHAGAPWRSAAFRWVSMLPALLLPPRTFYRSRQFLASRHWYAQLRKRVIPVPSVTVPDTPPATTPGNTSSHDH